MWMSPVLPQRAVSQLFDRKQKRDSSICVITANYHTHSTVFKYPRTIHRLKRICLNPARLLASSAPDLEIDGELESRNHIVLLLSNAARLVEVLNVGPQCKPSGRMNSVVYLADILRMLNTGWIW